MLFQIDPVKYKNITSGFGVLLKEQGAKGFFKGWVPTLLGYSAQGACKFGFYEFFKKYYSDLAGPENAIKYKTIIYLAGSASAEVIADVALCPMEAVKVRVQTQPGFARGLSDGLPKFIKADGVSGYAFWSLIIVSIVLFLLICCEALILLFDSYIHIICETYLILIFLDTCKLSRPFKKL